MTESLGCFGAGVRWRRSAQQGPAAASIDTVRMASPFPHANRCWGCHGNPNPECMASVSLFSPPDGLPTRGRGVAIIARKFTLEHLNKSGSIHLHIWVCLLCVWMVCFGVSVWWVGVGAVVWVGARGLPSLSFASDHQFDRRLGHRFVFEWHIDHLGSSDAHPPTSIVFRGPNKGDGRAGAGWRFDLRRSGQ